MPKQKGHVRASSGLTMPANEQPEGTVDEIEGSRSSNPTNKITRQEAREHFEIFSKKRKGQTGERGQRRTGDRR